jgi:signal transduction histidine kinase
MDQPDRWRVGGRQGGCKWLQIKEAGTARTRYKSVMRCRRFLVSIGACLVAGVSQAEKPLPRSTLGFEQSDVRGPFCAAIFSGLRTELNLNAASPVTLYVENLDLSRFNGPKYERGLLSHLRVKYRDRSVGAGALEFGLRWGAELWPGTPIVFAFVNEATIARLDLPDDVYRANDPPQARGYSDSGWQQYLEISAIVAVILLQSGLIIALLYEHSRRRKAEFEARLRLTELAHMNRRAMAGELSASVAHELNQPLGAILGNVETAERMLQSATPDLDKIREILADVRRDEQRASDVIVRLRSMLKKTPPERQPVDVNEVVRDVFDFVSVQASASGVTLTSALAPQPLLVDGDPIQLQEVVLNLVVNGMEALSSDANGHRRITGRTHLLNDLLVEVAIADSGPGIPTERLKQVFDPFFSGKEDGMGMGLSIARSIVEAHGGRIWAENQREAGALFRVNLPLAQPAPG